MNGPRIPDRPNPPPPTPRPDTLPPSKAPTHVVKEGETLESIATDHRVTPQELAAANGLGADATVVAHETLELPPNATLQGNDAPAGLTPTQRTDAAHQTYENARQQLASAKGSPGGQADVSQLTTAVAQAKQDFENAVEAEISAKVAQVNDGVPPQYRTPEDKLITQFGNHVRSRYAGDADAQAATETATADYQVQAQADNLIDSYYGNFSAAEKLRNINLDGQPQAVVDAVLADGRVQQWIREAGADIAKPYDGVTDPAGAQQQAPDAAKQLADLVDVLPPALATAVARECLPTIQKISQCEMVYGGQQAYNSMQRVVAALGDGPQAQTLTRQIADAYVPQVKKWEGFTTESTRNFAAAGGNPALGLALADSLQAQGEGRIADMLRNVSADGMHDYLMYNDASPLNRYNAAHEAANSRNERLSELLGKAGALSDDQKKALVEKFMADPDNAKIYQADADAAKALGVYMKENQASLLQSAGRNPEVAQQLYDSMKGLVASGQGKAAVAFAGAIANDPAAAAAFGNFSDYQGDFLPKALAAAQGECLVESGGDPESAAQAFLEVAEGVFKGQEGWDKFKDSYAQLAKGGVGFNATELAGELAKMGPSARGLAMASAMVSLFGGAGKEDIDGMINSFATAGVDITGVSVGVTQALADAGKLGRFTAAGEAFARFGTRLIPVLGLAVSTTAFVTDFKGALDGNPGYALALFGDVISVVGSVIELIPGGQLPGALINALGAILAVPFELLGAWIAGNEEEEALQQETEKYLQQIGLDEATAKALGESDFEQMQQLLATGMTPEQIQDLGRLDPQLLQSVHGGSPYVGEWPKLLQATGLSGGDLYAMFKAADAGGPAGEGVARLAHILGHPTWFPAVANAQGKDGLIAALKEQSTTSYADEDAKRTLQNAIAWLESH